MRTAVRKLGNSSGVIIPKSLLRELDVTVGDAVDLALEAGRIVLIPLKRRARAGWAEASRGGGVAAPRDVGVRRGEIWLAALDPTVGVEIQKTRPCVVVSPAEMHDFLRTVTVAPMTTGSRPAPYRIPLRFR